MINKSYLDSLDQYQTEAVLFPATPLAVMAGAGAGKTKVITSRIINQVDNGIDPSSLFISAFTRASSIEMSERISDIANINDIKISTFHSLMYKFINDYRRESGLKWYDLFNEGKKRILLQNILDRPSKEFKNALNINADIGNVISLISKWKNNGLHHNDSEINQTRDDAPKNSDMYAAAMAYPIYEDYLKRNFIIDFDDMLFKSMDLLYSDIDALNFAKSIWNGFFVDEAQDTNILQWKILEILAVPEDEPNITVVGDLRQCLFSFRGATPEIFEQFIVRYKNAKIIDLINNYRSNKFIVDSANKLAKNIGMKDQVSVHEIGEAPEVYIFDDVNDQADVIAKNILELRNNGVSGGDIAVLIRTNAQSASIESAFIANEIPYWCNGGGFFDRMEIGDIMAYLKLANSDKGFDFLERIINKPTRYLGAAFVESVKNNYEKYDNNIIKSIRLTNSYGNRKLSEKQRKSAIALSSLLIDIRENDGESISPSVAIGKIIERTEYIEWLKNTYGINDSEGSSKLDNLEVLKSIASDFTSVRDLIIFSEKCLSLQIESNDATEISTIHRSKGSEWDHVWIANMHDDSIPHIISKKENDFISERRIAYVAFTRAKKFLKIGVPSKDEKGNKVEPSRFLYDSELLT